MDYLKDLQKIIQINSFTGNKTGVDSVGEIFDIWFKALGFETEIYNRESIGNCQVSPRCTISKAIS